MSSSPEPEHTAPTAQVRPVQDSKLAQDVFSHRRPRETLLSRTKSTSLLTQALAASRREDPSASAKENSKVSSQLFESPLPHFPTSQEQWSPPNKSSDENTLTSSRMPTIAPSSTATLRTTVSLGTSPTSSPTHFTFPSCDNIAALLKDHRHLFNRTRGRGTSLERTEKEKRVQQVPKGTYSTNPGDTGMTTTPPPKTPTDGGPISNNIPIEGPRAEYRSWRDARPNKPSEKAWSIVNQGGKDSQGRKVEKSVEKSIAEALAGIEHNTRSRKASHSLGFFKEGLPEDGLKRKDTKNRGRSKDGLSPAKTPSEQDQGKQRDKKGTVGREYTATQISKPTTPLETTREEDEELALRTNGLRLSPAEGLTTEEGYFDVTHTIETVAEEELRRMPPQLLAEIRKHNHNLTPGAQKGSSFSRSIPMTAAEKSMVESEEISLEFTQPSGEENDHELKLAELKHVDEEDDSGEEQISSALFVPHQTPHESPERARDESRDAELSPTSDRNCLDRTNSQQWLEEHEVTSDEINEQSISEDIKVRPAPTPTPNRSQRVLDTKPSGVHDSSELEPETFDDGYSTATGDESSFTDDPDTTPTGSLHLPFSHAKQHKVQSISEKQKPKGPLEAIELIPYKHQVGGHTTMWRFSKRAVCKQLNNRENEFYEQVERYHPKLLHFLPRYIGVLNVTFEKQARRKSHRKDNTEAAVEREKVPSAVDSQDQSNEKPVESGAANGQDAVQEPSEQPRMISQSMHSSSVPIPTVTFANNRHIIPTSFLQPHPHAIDAQHRSKSDTAAPLATNREQPQSQPPLPDAEFTFRPTLSDKHAASWGATTVNKKLRNEVFGEAFLQQPIPIHRHKRPASQHRSLPHRHGHNLRPSNSESSLKSAQNSQTSSAQPAEESIRRRALKAAAEKRRNGSIESSQELSRDQANSVNGTDGKGPGTEEDDADFEGKAGTSAPEPEISRSNQNGPHKKPKRRYSSGGLRRKPSKVEEGRGHLKYFEEADDADAGYKGDGEEDVFSMDPEPTGPTTGLETTTPRKESRNGTVPEATPPIKEPTSFSARAPQASGPADISHLKYLDIPRPVNPKEAQTHQGSRVEYFLLLEDLTAGMKRPCIMDLKMGTRQYGVDANEKKQKSQRQKCEATTSQELGVRLCGLQVWDVKTQTYVFQDKYFGRSLQAGSQFQEALTRFLYDGVDYISVLRHIPTILQKLSQLEVIIRGLTGYRFYAASLLMFYDGDIGEEEETDSAATERGDARKKHEIDFKIADFANCVTKEDLRTVERTCPPRHPNLPDKGFLRGLKSLKKYFLAIQREHDGNAVSGSERNNGCMNALHDGAMDYETDDEGGISY